MADTYPLNEVRPVLFYDSLHDSSINISKPDAKDCADHQEHRQADQVLGLNAGPAGHNFLNQEPNTLPEKTVHVSFSF
jgi:hypothetical protein